MNHSRTTMSKKCHHTIVNHDEIPAFCMHLWPTWVDGYLIEGIDGLTFLEFNQGAEKFFSISLSVPFPIEISTDDSVLREAMSFLKHSFKFFADKYKEDYAFHYPLVELSLENLEITLSIAMRLKQDIA